MFCGEFQTSLQFSFQSHYHESTDFRKIYSYADMYTLYKWNIFAFLEIKRAHQHLTENLWSDPTSGEWQFFLRQAPLGKGGHVPFEKVNLF